MIYEMASLMAKAYDLKIIDWIGVKDWDIVTKKYFKKHFGEKPISIDAFLHGRNIFIKAGYGFYAKTVLLLHEIGHLIFHSGDMLSEEWKKRYWKDPIYHWKKEYEVSVWVYNVILPRRLRRLKVLGLFRSINVYKFWQGKTAHICMRNNGTAIYDLWSARYYLKKNRTRLLPISANVR